MDHKHDHSHRQHDHGTHGGAPAQADPGKAIDPVCGMQVTIKPEARQRDYEGQTFYFCSDGCQAKFDGDPWFYASGAAVKVEKSAPAGTQWTCPMHPEIRQIGPGTCPKCGMALEPVMPGLEDDDNPELADFRRRFWWTLPLTVIVTVIAMSGGFFDPMLGAARLRRPGWPPA